jgi:hypothetical protein
MMDKFTRKRIYLEANTSVNQIFAVTWTLIGLSPFILQNMSVVSKYGIAKNEGDANFNAHWTVSKNLTAGNIDPSTVQQTSSKSPADGTVFTTAGTSENIILNPYIFNAGFPYPLKTIYLTVSGNNVFSTKMSCMFCADLLILN